ncbi:MAG: hypothetical protein B6D61_00150 [Bacteroidetes bacterium 4484_249]|nr:MAG: hypothetical protein B6D61_00150 [Bacteroidetes bacterium 4484_249]
MITTIKNILLHTVLLLFPITLLGQGDPLLRVEIETKSDAATYKIASCGEKGVIMFYETTIEQDDYKFWVFVFYNKFLHETWKKDVPVYKNMKYSKKKLRGNFLYILFHDADKKKSEYYNYQILKINISEGSYELFSGDIPDKAEFEAFDEYGNYIIAGLNVEDDQSGIYGLNIESKETNPIFEIKDNRSRFENIYVDTLRNSYVGIFNVYESKTVFYMLLKEFDENTNNIHTLKLIPEAGKKFNTAKIITVNENERFLIGTYDIVKGNSVDKKGYFGNESSGFYIVKISGNQQKLTRYYNFLELENMTGYLKSKEYQQARKKAGKKEDGKDKYSVDFDLLLHDIIHRDSLFYFIAEAIYEEYHTVTNTYFDYYGRPVPVSYSVFDGYKYFNAFITCFDEDGNKLWDNGMEIFNILSFDLKNRVSTYFIDDEIVMAYNREGKIAAKIIKGPEVVEGVEYYLLESTYVNDKIMKDTKSNMIYWYDNYFIAYGFQIIKNNSLMGNSKRNVFYINKVAFQ